MDNDKNEKHGEKTNEQVEEPIISRFSDDSTFAPRVVIKGDGKNPMEAVE